MTQAGIGVQCPETRMARGCAWLPMARELGPCHWMVHRVMFSAVLSVDRLERRITKVRTRQADIFQFSNGKRF